MEDMFFCCKTILIPLMSSDIPMNRYLVLGNNMLCIRCSYIISSGWVCFKGALKMEISSLWRHFRPCSKRLHSLLLESFVDCRIYPNQPYICISCSLWQYWSTYYIPLPQQFASFACYFHIVEWISQSQTLEYRFGRYLPVLFAHVHKILKSCLTAYQIYSW